MVALPRKLEVDPLAPGSEAATHWELLVQERHQRHVFRLPESGIVTVGRGSQCELRLDDDSVSRQHARLYLPGLEIEDGGNEFVFLVSQTLWYGAGIGLVRREVFLESYENGFLVDAQNWTEELVSGSIGGVPFP